MLADLWPTLRLRLETPRLALRIPDDDELARLAAVAAGGVHRDGERPFLTPWTEGTAEERAEHVLRNHWGCLAEWSTDDWCLSLAVFPTGGDEPLGSVTLRARDFPVTREVRTTSWLGLEHQGQGYGTEARTALLTLAFDHLGATDALTEVFQDNHASQGVSRRLGYRPDGISRDPRDGEVLVSDRLRLTSARWADVERVSVSVAGLDAARAMFGRPSAAASPGPPPVTRTRRACRHGPRASCASQRDGHPPTTTRIIRANPAAKPAAPTTSQPPRAANVDSEGWRTAAGEVFT